MTVQEFDDCELVQSIAHGDMDALDTLYTRYGLQILNYLIGQLTDRQLAEEVLQDVMLGVWDAAPNFRRESKVRTWLFAIARYQAIGTHKRHEIQQVPLSEGHVLQGISMLETVERDTERLQIIEAIHALPSEQRETVEFVFYHGLSGPETAEVLGVAVGTIKSRLHRALNTLRWLLSSEGINHA